MCGAVDEVACVVVDGDVVVNDVEEVSIGNKYVCPEKYIFILEK